MKFSFYERDSLGLAGITATPETYDGVPPIPTLQFDFDLRKMHRDRFAVAAVLFFSEFISGPVNFPDNVSPEIARSIETYLYDRDSRVMTVDYDPYAAPTGINMIDVSSRLRAETPQNEPDEVRTVYLDVLPGDEWFGSISHIDHVITSTNGHVIGSESPTRRLEILIASALSLCDWVFADAVRVPGEEDYSDELFNRLSDLLSSCNVQLVRPDFHK